MSYFIIQIILLKPMLTDEFCPRMSYFGTASYAVQNTTIPVTLDNKEPWSTPLS